MSFLYDPKLNFKLLQSSLQKKSQTNPNIINLAKKLSNKLLSQFNNINSIEISAQPNTNLNVNNLTNLYSLLSFLDDNKVKVDGERISYQTNYRTGEPLETISDSERAKLDPITVNTSRDAFTKKWNEADYLTNIPSLIKYVSYLQDKSSKDKLSDNNNIRAQGELLEILTGKIVNSINTFNPNSGLKEVEKSEPGKPKELDDAIGLDYFGTKVFDPKNYFKDNGIGAIKLSASDLKSKETLNNWLLNSPVAEIIVYDKNNKAYSTKYTDPNANPCAILHTLYLRAKYRLSRANTEEATKSANFYLKKLDEISKLFTDPEGKACSITSFVETKNVNQNKIENTEPVQKQKSMDFDKVAQILPLRLEDVSFIRINNFIDGFSSIVSYDKRNELAGIKQIIQTSQQDIRSRLKNSDKQTFSMNAEVGDIIMWLKSPPGNHYTRFLESLYQVIEGSEEAISLFKQQFADDPNMQRMHPTQLSWLYAQIGKTPTDNSIAYRNKTEIKGWMNQVSTVNLHGKAK